MKSDKNKDTLPCYSKSVLSKVDDFATLKKVEVHAENSTF